MMSDLASESIHIYTFKIEGRLMSEVVIIAQ
jgi:hypothetical protein